MFKRISQFLLVACLVTSVLSAADDPFVAEWKQLTTRDSTFGKPIAVAMNQVRAGDVL